MDVSVTMGVDLHALSTPNVQVSLRGSEEMITQNYLPSL